MPLTGSTPRIHYDLHGSEGPEVVLVMGLGMRGAIWKPQTDDLARDHRLVTMDHRGLGGSPDAPGFPLSMAELAADVRRVVAATGFRRPHLVGVSMGGMIAQELAIAAPDAFASVTLIATHPGRSPTTIPPLRSIRNLRRAFTGAPQERQAAFYELLYPEDYVRSVDRAALSARVRAQFGTPTPMPVLAAQLSAIARHDTSARLRRITAPVLLVRPDRDVLVRPVGTDRLAALLPHAEVLRFADAGHGITFQKADELNAALRSFFARSS